MVPIRDRLPTRSFAFVNYLLIATNIVVFLWERAMLSAGVSERLLLPAYALVPAFLTRAPLLNAPSIVTSMFMHDPSGWLHLGGNMLFLWIFGDNVEDAMGHGRYLAFYLCAGLAAAMGQVLVDPTSQVPMLGASGAIAGVLAAYGSLYPRSPITVVNPIPLLWLFFGILLEVPAWLIILEFFAANLLNGLGGLGSHGGVAFFAHLGGFLAGLFLVRIFVRPDLERAYDRWSGWQARRAPAGPMYDRGYASRRGPWGA